MTIGKKRLDSNCTVMLQAGAQENKEQHPVQSLLAAFLWAASRVSETVLRFYSSHI